MHPRTISSQPGAEGTRLTVRELPKAKRPQGHLVSFGAAHAHIKVITFEYSNAKVQCLRYNDVNVAQGRCIKVQSFRCSNLCVAKLIKTKCATKPLLGKPVSLLCHHTKHVVSKQKHEMHTHDGRRSIRTRSRTSVQVRECLCERGPVFKIWSG